MHLMDEALTNLRQKGYEITDNEYTNALAAILLHDVGHGPFSHALEHTLVQNIQHETISFLLMQQINREWNGALDTAIAIFNDTYSNDFCINL